jgi:hypothetical protein
MDRARAITATFAAGPQTLTVATAGNGVGQVSGGGILCGNGGTACTATPAYGTVVTLTATPSGTDMFAGWSGAGCSGTGACAVTMTAAQSVTATFAAGPRTVTVVLDPNQTGTGTVTSAVGISCPGTCAKAVAYNTSVTLVATATGGSTFGSWSGADATTFGCTTNPSCLVSADVARTITATFNAGPQALTVTLAGTGASLGASVAASGLTCAGTTCTGTYAYNANVSLTASTTGTTTFAGWSGACTGAGACTVAMTGTKSVTASFTAGNQALTATKTGSGAAAGGVSATGLTCAGVTCTGSYAYGANVTLTAAPGTGDTFNGWSGVCTGAGTCTVAMTAARAVSADFSAGNRTLTATTSGSGTLNTSPAGINSCSGACSATFASGTLVSLMASPASGWSFLGWGGACTGASTTCNLTLNADASVSAAFNPRLSVTASGPGSVGSAPAGISCSGATCSSFFTYNGPVTLTATPSAGAVFLGWSGGPCSGTSTSCTVVMSDVQTTTASFGYPLAVTIVGNGSVAGTSINCPAVTCGANFTPGTMVTLTPTGTAHSSFFSWTGGGCSGTGPCTVTMSQAQNVKATFANEIDSLTVTTVGDGGGGVTSADGNISTCHTGFGGVGCSGLYTYGTSVKLTATPDANMVFDGWTGVCSGTGTCTVAVTGNLTATAAFNRAYYNLAYTESSDTATAATTAITGGTLQPGTNPISCTLAADPNTGFYGCASTASYARGSAVQLQVKYTTSTGTILNPPCNQTPTWNGCDQAAIESCIKINPKTFSCTSTCTSTLSVDRPVDVAWTSSGGGC